MSQARAPTGAALT